MADLVNPTTNVSIYGGDNDPDRSAAVTVTTDGSKERLDVSTTITGVDVPALPQGDRFHILDVQSPGSFPVTLATHTVNTGKTFSIFGWRMNTDGAIFEVDLQIDGTRVDKMRQKNSAFTSVGSGTIDYGLVPLAQADAGEVIRIQALSGDTGKEFISFFWGLEIDA